MAKKREIHRSSITGRIITPAQAKRNPKTSETERVRIGKLRKKK